MVITMIDILPALLELIQREFNLSLNKNKKLKEIEKLIADGKATYKQAYEYSKEVGTILAETFDKHITSEQLPDGKMYYNIAERILNPTLSNNHNIVVQICVEIQEQLNKSVGINLKGVEPKLNQFRIDSLINRIEKEEIFDDVAWILQEPIINFTQSVVDDTIKENVTFQGESGLYPKIIRTANYADACDWCKQMEGVYKYPTISDDVYTRHDRCRCTVEYDPGDARRQNVWTKEWR